MERIQSAIAKARAARRDPAAPPSLGGTAAAPQPNAQADAVWERLIDASLDPGHLEANRIVAHRGGPESASFDMMRTNLMRHLRDHGWTRLVVTSPNSGCGKTTTCLNLAFSLARQTDLRVLVLELDLRRPSMARTLGLKGDYRFASVLGGTESPERQLRRHGTNLAFGVTSVPVNSPAELFHSTQTAEIVDAIEAQLKPDVILFDMPPVLMTDDTIAFLDQVDCALMIAAAEQSTTGEIDRCGKELAAHTKVLGVVLNKCRFTDGEEGYGRGEY